MTTALELPGMTVRENLGVVYGLVVRSMGFAGSVAASFKALRRGEISQYTQLLEDSRRHAIDRMVDNARLMDADAVVAVRFDSSEIGQQFTEIVAYGTAVKVAPTRRARELTSAARRRRPGAAVRSAQPARRRGRLDIAGSGAPRGGRRRGADQGGGGHGAGGPAAAARRVAVPARARAADAVTATQTRPAADWRPTAERFRDPRTNRVMRVWEDAGGGRHYLPTTTEA